MTLNGTITFLLSNNAGSTRVKDGTAIVSPGRPASVFVYLRRRCSYTPVSGDAALFHTPAALMHSSFPQSSGARPEYFFVNEKTRQCSYHFLSKAGSNGTSCSRTPKRRANVLKIFISSDVKTVKNQCFHHLHNLLLILKIHQQINIRCIADNAVL